MCDHNYLRMSGMSIGETCKEHCKPYNPGITEFTSVLDYEQCLSECEELYGLLIKLAELVKKQCEEKSLERPERVRDRFLKGCIGHNLGLMAYNPQLVEKLLRLIAGDVGIKL